jgi:predicted transport protein
MSNVIIDRSEEYYTKGYLLEKLVVDTLKEVFSDLIESIECNIDQGLEAYKKDRGTGLDIVVKLKGLKYKLFIECKNINHEKNLPPAFFNKIHEMRFPVHKYGGDIYILINTAQESKTVKKMLKSRSIESWLLSEQVGKDNFENIKSELIKKYLKPQLFRIQYILKKYYYNRSIVSSIVSILEDRIHYTYRISNKIDRTKLIEMNEIQLNGHKLLPISVIYS